jgi:hypothetical protein
VEVHLINTQISKELLNESIEIKVSFPEIDEMEVIVKSLT